MSKHQTIKMIRMEIDRLNNEIDLCIIKGLPYKQHSLRHKFLMSQLSKIAPGRSNWLGKSFRFASLFIF